MKLSKYFLLAGLSLFVFAGCNDPIQPEEPENPSTEETPETPEDPETPETPEDPETPETPEDPERPESTYYVASEFAEYNYWGNIGPVTDNVVLELGTAPHDGMYLTGPGEMISLSLFIEPYEDYHDAEIVPGTYTFDKDETYAPMTIATESQRALYEPDKDGDGYMEETKTLLKDATLLIEETDKGYKVEAFITFENGETMYIDYEGELTFTNKYANMLPPEINEDKEFTCGYGELWYYGNAEYIIDIMSGGNPYEGGGFANRDRLKLEVIAKTADNTGLEAGTYTIGAEGPGSALAGGYEFDGYTGWAYGSRYFKFDDTVFEETNGYLVAGTIVVERDGDNYKITVDALDAGGYSVNASFEGPLELKDNSGY